LISTSAAGRTNVKGQAGVLYVNEDLIAQHGYIL